VTRRDPARAAERGGAVCAVAGAVLLFVGTYLHPMGADPNDALAAFTEYAGDRLWIASHLTQLAGVALMVAALVVVGRRLEDAGSTSARIAVAAAVTSLAIAAALQAVDGIALRKMVTAWAGAPAAEKESLFHAAFAVRQVEVGLASIGSLFMGVTVVLYGVALLGGDAYPRWLGALAIAGGVPTAVAGVIMAYTGFSALAMDINMPASSLVLVWIVMLAVAMW